MSLTKIGSIGINTGIKFAGVTTITTLNSATDTLTIGGNVSIAGTLTYEDVTNVDSVGLITARDGLKVNIGSGPPPDNGGAGVLLTKDGNIIASGITTIKGNVKVGIGITLSPDGDVFFTGVATGNGSGLTNLPAANITGTLPAISGANLTNLTAGNLTGALPAISGANLTGLAAGGAFIKGVVGVTTLTPVGIETSTVTRKDLIGPAGNTSTGAGSSFHGAYMGDGFLSFNTEFSSSSGYYISTFTNALVAGPMQLGSTVTIDGHFTIV